MVGQVNGRSWLVEAFEDFVGYGCNVINCYNTGALFVQEMAKDYIGERRGVPVGLGPVPATLVQTNKQFVAVERLKFALGVLDHEGGRKVGFLEGGEDGMAAETSAPAPCIVVSLLQAGVGYRSR